MSIGLTDIGFERAVLACICQYNSKSYFDVCDILNANCFTSETNNAIYRACENLFQEDGDCKLDPILIQTKVKNLGFGEHLCNQDHKTFLKNLFVMPVKLENCRKFAGKIRKLEIARRLHGISQEVQKDIENLTGDESIDAILQTAENPILEFTNLVNSGAADSDHIHVGIDEFIQNIIDNPNKTIGISSGYPLYDACIGGGFRRGGVSLIGARTKVGKTLLAENICWYITTKLNIPVLYLDTEMSKGDHWVRTIANITGIPINDIEQGKFVKDRRKLDLVLKAKEQFKKNSNYVYANVAGKNMGEIIAVIRRWLLKYVGIGDNGKMRDCLVVYDYFKLMSSDELSKNLQETQQLGFNLTQLVNFAIKYDFPVSSFVQLNRDGIDAEATNAISQSDRIAWYCSNFSIYKYKSDEEIAQDGPKGGNRKLVPVICRHGPGLQQGEYICFGMQGQYGRITELTLNTALEKEKSKDDDKQNGGQSNSDGDIPF